jgi:hypothetical protein
MTPEQLAILEATLAAQKQAVKLDAAALEQLEKLYRAAAQDIQRQIAAAGGADGNVSLQELQTVLAQVNARLKQLTEARDRMFNQNMAAAISIGADVFVGLGIAAQIHANTVRTLRNFVGPDGLQLSDRIWRLDRQARDLITNAVESAVIQGQGAAQAARELLARGEAVTAELAAKMRAANAQAMAEVASELLTGVGSPMDNAMRVMRTEINRAHGTAYAEGFMQHPDAAGLRFMLSPGHPKPDICDLLSRQNLYGLGLGVYPTLEDTGWPAHPNTISFVVGVFKDEVTAADRAGKETHLQALDRLTPAQQIGVLGKNKHEVFKAGKLTPRMIRTPWREVQKTM